MLIYVEFQLEKIINQKRSARQRKHTVKVIRKWNESIYVHFFYSTIDKCRLEHFSKKQFNWIFMGRMPEASRRKHQKRREKKRKKDKISGKNRDGKRSWHILHISAETEALRNTNNTFKKYSLWKLMETNFN